MTSEPITGQIDVLLAPTESGLDPPSNPKMPFIKPFYQQKGFVHELLIGYVRFPTLLRLVRDLGKEALSHEA